jgi:predicted dehydrogenase
MATTMEDCRKMVDAAKQHGKKLMIGYYQTLTEAHVRAKQILDTGELGDILTFTTIFGHAGPEMWSADKGSHTWFFKKDEAAFGAMADLGVHKLDLLQWLIGAEIDQVSAFVKTLDKKDETGNMIGVDDNSICLLGFKNGVIGTLAVSWTNYADERNSTVLNCTNGVMRIYEHPDYPIEVQFKNKEKVFYKIAGIHSNDSVQPNTGVIDMFVDAILQDKEPEFSGEYSLKTMEAVFAALESAKTGKTIWI